MLNIEPRDLPRANPLGRARLVLDDIEALQNDDSPRALNLLRERGVQLGG